MAFSSISDTLHEHSTASVGKQVDAAMVIEHTNAVLAEMFGGELAQEAKPLFLKNRTLTITCTSSAMASELRLNQAAIVEKINEKLGKNEVDRIRYLA